MLQLADDFLVFEVRRAFFFQFRQSGCYFFFQDLQLNRYWVKHHPTVSRQLIKSNIFPNTQELNKCNWRLAVSISFSLASFFSMVFCADSFLLSYSLVPAASSIIDRICQMIPVSQLTLYVNPWTGSPQCANLDREVRFTLPRVGMALQIDALLTQDPSRNRIQEGS